MKQRYIGLAICIGFVFNALQAVELGYTDEMTLENDTRTREWRLHSAPWTNRTSWVVFRSSMWKR